MAVAIDVKARCGLLFPALLQSRRILVQRHAAAYDSRLRESVQEELRLGWQTGDVILLRAVT